jgi:fatty acid/phospholipid biosynthesis enzyme
MATKQDVERFLNEFHEKMKIWDIFFRDERGKNTQTLADLEIRPADRVKIIREISAIDYSEGPLEERLYQGSSMWVFGKEVKSKEVYIKITMGAAGSGVLCISFHIADRPMNFPFKNNPSL